MFAATLRRGGTKTPSKILKKIKKARLQAVKGVSRERRFSLLAGARAQHAATWPVRCACVSGGREAGDAPPCEGGLAAQARGALNRVVNSPQRRNVCAQVVKGKKKRANLQKQGAKAFLKKGKKR